MLQYIIAAELPDDTPLTAYELLVAAVAARTYATTQAKADAISRLASGPAGEVFVKPAADIYVMDAYKKVRNGVCDTGDPLAEADFTAQPGGGVVYAGGDSRRIGNGADLKNRVCYQHSGGAVRVEFEVLSH